MGLVFCVGMVVPTSPSGLIAAGVDTGAGAGGTAPGAGYTAEQLSKMSDAEYFAYKASQKK